LSDGWILEERATLLEFIPAWNSSSPRSKNVPDPRARNARHVLCELLVVAFDAVLCGATNCAEMAAFGHSKRMFSATS
jgi:DDE family transposase